MGCSTSSPKDTVEEVRPPADKVLQAVLPSEDDTLSTKSPIDEYVTSMSPKSVITGPVEEERPVWSKQVLSSGADKDIFAGTFKGRPVAVCVAKQRGSGWSRIQNEINVFRTLGSHPNIVKMYYSGMHRGNVFLALEIVEPIGYDLDRLKNMYSFAGQAVPSSLMARIFHQLVSALKHMHRKGIIHRDLKTENILINEKHEAKVIDMGIACKVGTRDTLRAGYLAPELCEGRQPLSPKVDAWGLGIILHQVYQNQWKVLTEAGPVKILPGKPSDVRPMEKPVREAMCGLLQLSPSSRWGLSQLLECEWLDHPVSPEASQGWNKIAVGDDVERRYLRRYVSNKPLPTALAVFISVKNHAHLIGKPVNSLGLSSVLGITVMLINYGRGSYETIPGGNTLIKENSWVYFGVPQGEGQMQQAVAGLEKVLASPESSQDLCRRNARLPSPSTFRVLNKQEVIQTGKLVEFTVEFDCFSFPSHIGSEAVIGDNKKDSCPATPKRALHLRRQFHVNLVGIQRSGGQEPQWFPRANAVVGPDDLGLVVRLPCMDGSTMPTLTDQDLLGLMEKEKFRYNLQMTDSLRATTHETIASAGGFDPALPGQSF